MREDPELPEGLVSLLFTDIQGSTALLLSLGDAFGDVLNQHMRETWSRYGGVEVDNEGDAVFVALPEALDAIEAATAVQHRFAEHPWPGEVDVRVRMGLHAGEPRVRGRRYWGDRRQLRRSA